MIIDKLKEWEYYEKKIPLYIQNSFGTVEHFKIVFDLLADLDTTEDEVINLFDILNEDYHDLMKKYDNSEAFDEFSFLDNLGKLYGINRTFRVKYTNVEGDEVNKAVHLNNDELLALIKGRILQNNFDGTMESLIDYYNKMGFKFIIKPSSPAEVLYFFIDDGSLSENMKALMESGLLVIKSMGISYYIQSTRELNNLGIWDSIVTSWRGWDVAEWGGASDEM